MSDWTRDYFERGYAQRWGLAPPGDQIQWDADGLWRQLKLEHGAQVLDIACGHGRFSMALAQRGARVVGVDFADALLARARQLSARSHFSLVRADMRRLPLRSRSCSAAILTDAFGFFETDDEHDAVLAEAVRVLRQRGRFGLKVVNGDSVVADFRDIESQQRDGVSVQISRTLVRSPARMTETITVSGARGDGTYERRQRLYSAKELRDALERVGLRGIEIFADAHGARFDTLSSTAMWAFGEVPRP